MGVTSIYIMFVLRHKYYQCFTSYIGDMMRCMSNVYVGHNKTYCTDDKDILCRPSNISR